jgi:putrescine transport system ATP-binding protein
MSALDKQIRHQTQIELVRILEQVGVTCILVTHDQEEAMTMAHRLAVMTEGQIVQCGAPQEVYAFPNSRFVAGFIGKTNLFTGTIVVDEPDHVAIESDALARPLYVNHGVSEPLGMEVHVSIRPECLVVSRRQPAAENNWSHGMVTHMAWMGSYALYQIRLDAGMLVEASVPSMMLAQAEAPGLDDEVFVSWDADSATVLAS